MALIRNTVDRLDKASSYGAKSVRETPMSLRKPQADHSFQNKRRRYNDGDEGINGDREKSPDMDEKLKTATTLYVGNL